MSLNGKCSKCGKKMHAGRKSDICKKCANSPYEAKDKIYTCCKCHRKYSYKHQERGKKCFTCILKEFEDREARRKEALYRKMEKLFVCDTCKYPAQKLYGKNECWTCRAIRQKAEKAAIKSFIKIGSMTDAIIQGINRAI